MHKFYVNDGADNPNAYIAHGGGIHKYTYRNSLEAVEDSLQKGFVFIELDLLVTADGHIVAAHDWEHFKSITQYPDASSTPMTLAEVKAQKINGTDTPLSGADIRELMQKNENFFLVTDKIKDYSLLLNEIPFPERMIVEVFDPYDYLKALLAGVRYPAYCLWEPKDYNTPLRFGLPLVTMSGCPFFDTPEHIDMVRALHAGGVTILLFIPPGDETAFLKAHLGRTVSKVYVDNNAPPVP
ncbi:MAG: hypothetical protein J6N67_05400 [Desulfovibrio sp.]|nr:hypothetical protein [Desulfovibrio sp.]